MKEKIKDAIFGTLVISNGDSFEKYTWPKIEKIIKDENTSDRTSSSSSETGTTV